MKKCSNCGRVKDFNEFYKHPVNKDGKQSYCKICTNEYAKNRLRTLRGRALEIFKNQNGNSKKRGHNSPKYTRDEFVNWIMSNEDYLRIHYEWVESGYKKSLTPSVDRLDDYIGYQFDNIRVVTWGENELKGNLDRKKGINNKRSRAVVKMYSSGVEIETYHSIHFASRENGLHASSIWDVCNGKYKTAGGFCWKYAELK